MDPDATAGPSRAPSRSKVDSCRALTRRSALAAAGTVLLGAVAGCTTFSDADATPTGRPYQELRETPVYLADDVDLSLPDAVPTVTAPDDADLLVFPGEPDIDAERVVEWLADDRVVALLGDGAEETWIEWVQTDAYTDTFGTGGYGRSDPKPDLLVAAAIGADVTRYNKTWGDGPDDAEIVRALDETLLEIETRTPRPE